MFFASNHTIPCYYFSLVGCYKSGSSLSISRVLERRGPYTSVRVIATQQPMGRKEKDASMAQDRESATRQRSTHQVVSRHHSFISSTRSHSVPSVIPYCSYRALILIAMPVRRATSSAALFSPRSTVVIQHMYRNVEKQ